MLVVGMDAQHCSKDHFGTVGHTVGEDTKGFRCPALGSFRCLTMQNPNAGLSGYDNLAIAFFTIIQVISLEGWTQLEYFTQDGYSSGSWVFYQLNII